MLDATDDVDKVYVEQVLPGKMKWNLRSIEKFSFWGEIKVMFMTVFAVLGKEYGDEVIDTVDEVKVHEDSVV